MSVYGIIKPLVDAHTMGIMNCVELLASCNKKSIIANDLIADSFEKVEDDFHYNRVKIWIKYNQISHLIISFRLDPNKGFILFSKLLYRLLADKKEHFFETGVLKRIYYAGLPETCNHIKKEFGNKVRVFQGDESPLDTLKTLDIPDNDIPTYIKESSIYDSVLYNFGKELINSEKHHLILPHKYNYPEYGTTKDNVFLRSKYAYEKNLLPLIRVHAGPYSDKREEALAEYSNWLKLLSKEGFLDIMSVGSSQLSQSNFGEDWKDRMNGGGVPFNSEFELRTMREDASPMLIRAYSGTKNVRKYAQMLDDNLGNAWHALSIWWFNQIDERGELPIRESIKQHIETINYIAAYNKIFEPNVSHHFSFRGADDLTYVVSAYLAMKLAKKIGVKYVILQNMLNTPKTTWFINDIVKSRTLLKLVRSLEDKNFKILYQPRAGLDYFSPDLEKAKGQLSAITALMIDIEINRLPDIIHVVSYSEAAFLATPNIINDSIKIVKSTVNEYRSFRKKNDIISEFINTDEILQKEKIFYEDAIKYIKFIEESIPYLYSAKGFYEVMSKGYFPLPYLWKCKEELKNALSWDIRTIRGEVKVVDEYGIPLSVENRIEKIKMLNN